MTMFDELLWVRFEDSIDDIECLPEGEYILVLVVTEECTKWELRTITGTSLGDPIADGQGVEPGDEDVRNKPYAWE